MTGKHRHFRHQRETAKRRHFTLGGFLIGAVSLLGMPALAEQVPATATPEHVQLQSPRGTSPFTPEVYAGRRRALMEALGPGIALLMSATNRPFNTVADKQDPDFAYMTGIVDEANAALVMALDDAGRYREHLFLAPYTPEIDVWEGGRLRRGEEVSRRTGIDSVLRTSGIGGTLASLAPLHDTLHFLGPIVSPESPVPETLSTLQALAARSPGLSINNAATAIARRRAQKEKRELALMDKAIEATYAGHRAAMAKIAPGVFEHEVKTVIEAGFRSAGALELAFPSIVGSGPNAATLHYVHEDRPMGDGDLVVIDIGAEYERYAADITRTYPVSGAFSARQREIYELVLEAQAAAAAIARAGVTWDELNAAARAVFRREGLADAFLHSVGHYVGLEVHDAGGRFQPIPENAVITIEPGIYLVEENIGVRIEDQYLVTKRGAERLTTALPHTAREVEAAMQEAARRRSANGQAATR